MALGTTAAILGATALSGGGSFLGGWLGRNKAKQIGTIEQQAAEAEERKAMEQFGLTDPQIRDAYERAKGTVSTVGNRSSDDLLAAGREANAGFDPYLSAGRESLSTLSQLANAPEERFNFQFSQDDPSYQWRVAEAQKALERSAAARGTLSGGGTLKALTRYSQDAASQEYAAAFDRSLKGFEANKSARQQRLNTLAGLVNTGYGAQGQVANNIVNTNTTAAGYRNRAAELEAGYDIEGTGAQIANRQYYEGLGRNARGLATQARTGSMTAASNAWTQGLTGAFNAGAQGLMTLGMLGSGAPKYNASVPNWVYTGQMPGGRGYGTLGGWPNYGEYYGGFQ